MKEPHIDAGASLIIVSGDATGERRAIADGVVLGRDPSVDLRLDDDEVSRRHARVSRRAEGTYVIEDLGSQNGTWVNGDRVERAELAYGDLITVGGGTLILFTRDDPLQDRLLHMQRMQALGQLAAGVAHDFNNLLGAILTNATELLEQDDWSAQSAERVRQIEIAARRAGGITRQLLMFGRSDAPRPARATVLELVEEATELLAPVLPASIELAHHIEPGVEIVVDAHQFSQVLVNLCVNAADAMPDGGPIMISARRIHDPDREHDGRRVEILVRDAGCGMAPATMSQIFDPFFTTKDAGHGTGLGLAMVARVVRAHGGTIDVQSEPGRGTQFRIVLRSPGEAIPVEAAPADTTRLTPVVSGTVLLVEDEALIRDTAKRVLGRVGLTVLTAESAEQALELHARRTAEIDLVLMDLGLPGMPGDAAAAELLARDPSTCIIVASGWVDPDTRTRLLDAGVHAFLDKPYDAYALREAVLRALIEADA